MEASTKKIKEMGKNKSFCLDDSSEREATKRLAQRGQWHTPPLPVFATACANPASTGNLPTNPDEYARMLQEAYKRGAEAGRSVQCNNPPPTAKEGVKIATIPSSPLIQVNGIDYSSSAPTVVPLGSKLATVAHSKSMPDMTTFQASHVNDEEDKRKKRLARNRASARLRRLKKKNLVDSYEGEVGILESSLSKLRSHVWGSEIIGHDSLIEALSMERGQQPLTPENRKGLVQAILTQQRDQVANLLECQLENWTLCTLANKSDSFAGLNSMCSYPKTFSVNEVEVSQITTELTSSLRLTSKQVSLINQSSIGCSHEVKDLLTVDSCLESIHMNEWLLDKGVDEVAKLFTSILNPTQRSKFLLWSDHNAEPIENLDYVRLQARKDSGPLFEFGVDEGLADGDLTKISES